MLLAKGMEAGMKNDGVRNLRGIRLESALFGLLGLAAGAVRYFHLRTGFEPADNPEIAGLAVPGNLYGMLLATASVLVCIYLLVSFGISRFSSESGAETVVPGRVNGKARTFLILSALLAFFGAVLQFVDAFSRFSIWGIVSGGLLFGAGAAAVTTARAMGSRARGEGTNPPSVLLAVFWACAWLVEMYQGVSRSPTLLRYIFPVLGVISLILLFYFCAGYVFARANLSAVFCGVKAMLFFGPMNIVGETLFAWQEGTLLTRNGLFSVVRPEVFLLYGVCFAVAVLCLVRANTVQTAVPSEEEKAGELGDAAASNVEADAAETDSDVPDADLAAEETDTAAPDAGKAEEKSEPADEL